MFFDLAPFYDLEKHGYLRKVENDSLVLFNYTDKCTFERFWNKYTLISRGIIFEKDNGRLVALPLKKFFNLGEMEEVSLLNLPNESYRVYEKVDGSLGIIFYYKGKWHVATRGSFNSEQAVVATEILKKYNTSDFNTNCTYLVEIVYPSNKIVVDYGDEEKLVMLAAYNVNHQIEIPFDAVVSFAEVAGMPYAKEYRYSIEEMIELQKTMPKDQEGFVVRFQGGLRVKIKGHEYLKIAKILSQLSPLAFWEAMENGKVKEEYLLQVPEEFKKEFEPIVDELEYKYEKVYNEIMDDLKKLPIVDFDSREGKKTIGLFLASNSDDLQHPHAIFPALTSNGLEKYIMKIIRPNGNILIE